MKSTCQQLYFKDILFEFKKKIKEIEKETKCANGLDEIKEEIWVKLVEKWDAKIDNGEYKDIISFESNIEEAVDNINFLIEARGRCIISLLRQDF